MTLLISSPLQAVELNWQQNNSNGALSDYHGKPLILHFWASWCPPCRTEMPQLNAWKQQHPDAQLIVVSLDGNQADALLFLRQNHISFPAWITDSQQAMRMGVRGLPATILIDGDGNIQQRMIGARDWTDPRFSKLMLNWLNFNSATESPLL
ncbi:MAG: TlpA disulfide reductase family protein [Mariprofundales bacterium]